MSLWRRIYQERKKFALPLLVLLLGNIAVLLFAVVPLGRVVAGAETAREDARLKLRDAQVLELQAKNQKGSRLRADVELKKFYAEILPNEHDTSVSSAYYWPQGAAKRANLIFKSALNAVDPPKKGSTLSRYATKVILTGEYPNVQKFLYELETAEQFLILEKVTLSPASVATGTAGGSLELVLDIVTYFVAPPTGTAGTAGGQ